MRLGFLAALLLLTLGAPAARADGDVASLEPTSPALDRLGAPARPAVVEVAVAEALLSDAEEALALVHHLRHAGGSAAASGLARLAGHRDPAVRVAALDAAAQVGLRLGVLADATRRALESRQDAERRAAIAALGVVGDGRDVPALLTLAESPDATLAQHAMQALAALTGARPTFAAARWRFMWHGLESRAAEDLGVALRALATDPEGADAELHLLTLQRYGFTDVPGVLGTLRTWFQASDDRLRGLACRLAATLRLADLAPAILSTRTFAFTPELKERADEAIQALGAVE